MRVLLFTALMVVAMVVMIVFTVHMLVAVMAHDAHTQEQRRLQAQMGLDLSVT